LPDDCRLFLGKPPKLTPFLLGPFSGRLFKLANAGLLGQQMAPVLLQCSAVQCSACQE
jgi:hypothetical protein